MSRLIYVVSYVTVNEQIRNIMCCLIQNKFTRNNVMNNTMMNFMAYDVIDSATFVTSIVVTSKIVLRCTI